MALTYVYAVTSLKKTTDGSIDNVVVQTNWTCTGTDEDGYSGVFNGATPFPLSSVDPDNFIPYEQLTEADIIGWIEAVVVGSYKEHIDAQIMKQIALIKDPVVEVPSNELPWSPPLEEPKDAVNEEPTA
jgi:hypothetical protein